MKLLHICLLIMSLSHGNGNKCHTSGKPLHIKVLYESLCSHSQEFLLKFLPIYEEYKNCIHLTMIPYGKTRISHNKLVCQHGPDECWGNQMQTCALHTNLTKIKKAQFVACQMKDFKLTRNKDNKCTKSFQIEEEVHSCMLSDKVVEYQTKDAATTLKYPFNEIPAIVFNGVYKESLQEPALNHVRRTLCKQMLKMKHLLVENC